MKFTIEIFDEKDCPPTINVYGNSTFTPYAPAKVDLLYKFPYMTDKNCFETAIDLACKLKSAGFEVDVVRTGGDDK